MQKFTFAISFPDELLLVNVNLRSRSATGKMRMCGRADLRILEWVRVKIMDLD